MRRAACNGQTTHDERVRTRDAVTVAVDDIMTESQFKVKTRKKWPVSGDWSAESAACNLGTTKLSV